MSVYASYEVLEKVYSDVVGHRHLPTALTLFVSVATFEMIRVSFCGDDRFRLGRVINHTTGRTALRFNDGYIERRRWMRDGYVMFWIGRRNHGEFYILRGQ